MFKYFQKNKKTIIVIVLTTILSTLAVRATDNIVPFLTASLQKGSEKEKSVCPQEMVFVPTEKGGFCIDKYENSPGPDCPYKNPANQSQSRENLENQKCQPVSVPLAFPWTFISQDQAQLACAKAGKRLPTNEEWYLAALGTPDPVANWTKDDCQVNKNWDLQPGLTGSGKNCVSSFGAYDMIGNVWEWVKGTANDGFFEDKELPNRGYVWSTDGRGLPAITQTENPDPNYNEDFFWIQKQGIRAFSRGGYWDNQSRAGMYSVYVVYQPNEVGPGTGFRCVK